MTGLEILFILSLLPVLILWGWFVVQGFRTSKGWGWSLIFLFPVSPFLFAYRFERKTRKGIFYFIISLAVFAVISLYAHFFTAHFFKHFSEKLIRSVENISFSTQPKPAKPLNLPPPTPIPELLPEPDVQATVQKPVETEKTPKQAEKQPGRKTINVDEAQNYVGKTVIITTENVVHRGRLMSVGTGELQIRKSLGGGTILMGVPKSKIIKLEVL